MGATTVTATILGVDNQPIVGAYTYFRLKSVGTDSVATTTIDRDRISAVTDANGEFSKELWDNGDSGITSTLEIELPSGQRVNVIIPALTGTIDLWDLIENYQVGTADPQLPTNQQLFMRKADNLSDVADSATARTNLSVPSTTEALLGANNLSDVADAATARANLGVEVGVDVQAHDVILDTIETTITDTDLAVPTSGAVVDLMAANFTSRVIVKQASDLAGTLDSTKAYVLDGIIDMGAQSITVPTGGLTILGQSFDISGLTSSENNYILFVSESIAIGSGNLLMADIDLSVTGTSSKVYELYDATGFNAIEMARVNYTDCTSLGDLYDYRQGLEDGTGRFGGTPNLTLHGLWRGGFRITTSIVRSLGAGMTGALFQSGTLFQMDSRFLSDINCDLPASAALLDFAPADFPNPGTVQLGGCEITRDGVYDAEDANLTPNMDRGDLSAYWKRNNGLPNTFVGATTSITSEELTTIPTFPFFYDLQGIFTGTGLEHFSASADGKLTHLGNSPREFEVTSNLVLESQQNNQLTVRFRKWDDSASAFVDLDYTQQTRQVNNLSGTRDVAYFTLLVGVTLDQNDYLQLQVRNNSGNADVTAELSSFYRIQER